MTITVKRIKCRRFHRWMNWLLGSASWELSEKHKYLFSILEHCNHSVFLFFFRFFWWIRRKQVVPACNPKTKISYMYPKQQNTNWHHDCDNRCWLCEQIASTEFRNVLYVSRLRPLCLHFQSQSLCSRLSPITVRPLCVRALSRQFVFSAFGSIDDQFECTRK